MEYVDGCFATPPHPRQNPKCSPEGLLLKNWGPYFWEDMIHVHEHTCCTCTCIRWGVRGDILDYTQIQNQNEEDASC